jgi:hypothetical protein
VKGAHVLWTGKPGNLKPIIKTNDEINNLPTNVLFNGSTRTDALGAPIVSENGDVLFAATLKGAVTSVGSPYLIYRDDEVSFVIAAGAQAPGFPQGTVISALRGAISSKGVAFSGLTQSGFLPGGGIWFSDFNETKLLAASSHENTITIPETRATHFGDGCFFVLASSPFIHMNENGVILINNTYLNEGNNSDCPDDRGSMTTWDNSDKQFRHIAAGGDAVANMPGYSFMHFQASASGSMRLMPDNSVAVRAYIKGDSSTSPSGTFFGSWIFPNTGAPKLIGLVGESLSDASGKIVLSTAAVLGHHLVMPAGENEYALIESMQSSSIFPVVVKGAARDNPYTNAGMLGVNPMSVIAKVGDTAPQGEPSSFIGTIMGMIADEHGNLIIHGMRGDAVDTTSVAATIWFGKSSDQLKEIFFTGSKIMHNGIEKTVISMSPDFSPWGVGGFSQSSRDGAMVFEALLDNIAGRSILMISPASE